MILLQCVYHSNNTEERNVFLKGLDKEMISYVDTYVDPDTKAINVDRSVVVERSGVAHIVYHTVEDVLLALAGNERPEVGFKIHPYGNNV